MYDLCRRKHSSLKKFCISAIHSGFLTFAPAIPNNPTLLSALYDINPSKRFQTYVETCSSLFKSFTKQNLVLPGRVLHAYLIKMGMSSERFIAVKVLIMYLNRRSFSDAEQIVKEFDAADIVVQNCLVSAYVQWGFLNKARNLFDEMPERNEISWTVMISGLMKYGLVKEAMRYFWRNPFQDVVSWTAAISGFVQNGWSSEALNLFLNLLESGTRPNVVTLTSILKACVDSDRFDYGLNVITLIIKFGLEHDLSIENSLITVNLRMGELDLAKRIFDNMDRRDIVSWTSIMDVYVQMGDLNEARRLFDEMPARNEVSWSAMIARYGQNGHSEEALRLFSQMMRGGFMPNVSSFSSCLSSIADIKALISGMVIHGLVVKVGLERDVFVASSLIDLYCKCGRAENGCLVFESMTEKSVVLWNSLISGYCQNGFLAEAEELFEQMPTKNVVSWNAMITGYVVNEEHDLVFEAFHRMLLSAESPNKSTFSSVLCACANMASLERGKNVHVKIIKLQIQSDVFVGTALADMYAKSGDINSCRRLFDRMPERNEISWTVMIQGLAENGHAEESISLFDEMISSSSVVPNEMMLLPVLFACSHCGLVEKGLQYFNSMEKLYGIQPSSGHYTCMVDMLSRSGRLSEAEEIIKTMPFEPDANACSALLSGCRMYKNEEMAERTAKRMWGMCESNSGGYVLLSNVYALAGRWSDVMNVRRLMREKESRKSGACSWIEMKDRVHCFYCDDGSHSETTEIFNVLGLLKSEMMAFTRQIPF